MSVYERHTDANLNSILNSVIQKYDFEQRIFAITTDNAFNNKTMHNKLVQLAAEQNTNLIFIKMSQIRILRK